MGAHLNLKLRRGGPVLSKYYKLGLSTAQYAAEQTEDEIDVVKAANELYNITKTYSQIPHLQIPKDPDQAKRVMSWWSDWLVENLKQKGEAYAKYDKLQSFHSSHEEEYVEYGIYKMVIASHITAQTVTLNAVRELF